jgi:hypothetical protein
VLVCPVYSSVVRLLQRMPEVSLFPSRTLSWLGKENGYGRCYRNIYPTQLCWVGHELQSLIFFFFQGLGVDANRHDCAPSSKQSFVKRRPAMNGQLPFIIFSISVLLPVLLVPAIAIEKIVFAIAKLLR